MKKKEKRKRKKERKKKNLGTQTGLPIIWPPKGTQ